MKTILPALFVFLSSSIAHVDIPKACSTLEGADLSLNTDSSIVSSSNIAFSSDRQKIAIYQVSDAKQQATFKLFDSNTGKLLQQQTLNHYEERSRQTRLGFSPQDRIVYLQGMSYSTKRSADYGAIPFWNLANNQIVFSPCSTAMGVSDVQFSDDKTVAYSSTVDSFSSLCSTQEEKALALIGQSGSYQFNPTTKHLYANDVETNPDTYQSLVKRLGEDIKHVSLYQSPVAAHPYDRDSRNTFASLQLGTAPNHRQLIAKSEGDRLTLSYWDHAVQQNPPKKIYQQVFTIAELGRGAISVPYHHSQLSPDEKQLAFISKTGVLLVFDVESGKLRWKKNLPIAATGKDSPRYNLEESLIVVHGEPASALVITKDNPKTLYLYDWQTGKQRELVIPDAYNLTYQQYGRHLVFEAMQPDAQSLLLVNWETGQQQVITLPEGFRYFAHEQFYIANKQQLVLKNIDTADSIIALNLNTGKYQSLKAPYPDERYYSSEYIRLGDKHYRLLDITTPTDNGEAQTNIQLYDVATKQTQTLLTADVVLYAELIEREAEAPEYHTVAYDGEAGQTMFCRWSLGRQQN